MAIKLIDHHTHTNESPDADPKLTMEDYVKKAISVGSPGVMFTDHVDYDYPSPIFNYVIDYGKYYQTILELRKNYAIDILMGVEIGYQPHIEGRINDFLNTNAFDFVICSIHICDGLDLYNGDFFKGKNQFESYQRYFECVLESVKNFDNYDIFGHIDYIIRYGDFDVKDYPFDHYQPIIDEILLTIIQKGKGIELNTSGLRYKLGVMHPKFELVKRYKDLGGFLITLGSDAHHLKDYQADFKEALQLLRDAGFDQVTHYKNRKPYFIKIV